ncbi:MAG: hypothetical protein EBR82_37975 [Caulobacteraceae bacterium]|nr:hypothetical protein [Caulobacteraceae bacterium]
MTRMAEASAVMVGLAKVTVSYLRKVGASGKRGLEKQGRPGAAARPEGSVAGSGGQQGVHLAAQGLGLER